ncbi:hypothetical protein [Vitiosangium sp. GDMCC 1.1324]|uniref:hypothetical protein n=1 Tax=Vitiosangium sp. (strain GDMCC 1.1324) TaxID=2138576 RepID=UPI0011B62786|nr:hypothetical protein [Vitiosangium sp. GDMCC 1.1324]
MRRRRAARERGQGGWGWAGLDVELSGLPGLFRRRWKLGVLCLGLVLLIALLREPFHVGTYEYGGSCGRFRSCATTLWGLAEGCHVFERDASIEPGLEPFAAETACGADWAVLHRDVHWFGGAAGSGGGGAVGEVVENLIDIYRQQRRVYQQEGRFASGPVAHSGLHSYQERECAGLGSSFSEHAYQVVLAANLDEDPDEDCWLLTSRGELRHVQRD